jgi:hypothetical protein
VYNDARPEAAAHSRQPHSDRSCRDAPADGSSHLPATVATMTVSSGYFSPRDAGEVHAHAEEAAANPGFGPSSSRPQPPGSVPTTHTPLTRIVYHDPPSTSSFSARVLAGAAADDVLNTLSAECLRDRLRLGNDELDLTVLDLTVR